MLYSCSFGRLSSGYCAYVLASEVLLSPILVRPVREQLEHDRVIRLLQAKYKRKFEVAINPGNEQSMPVGAGPAPWYPDLVLQSQERSRKLQGVVEVETAESVNHLEAMSQWAALSKLRAPFHLSIPGACIDSARRLVAELAIPVAEMWAYHAIGDQIRFTLVQKSQSAEPRPSRAAAEPPQARAATPRPASNAARPAGARPAAARPAAAPSRPATSSRSRNGRSASAPSARRPAAGSATRRKPAAKPKAAAARRPAAKSAASRKSSSSRAQKRR
jgi:hypothetical protein